QSITATHTFSSVEYWTTPSTSNSSLYKVRDKPSRRTICCWAKSSTVPMQFKRRRPFASALWKSTNTFGLFTHDLPGSRFPGGVGDRRREQPTHLFRCESSSSGMTGTSASSAYHVTPRLTDRPNGGHPDLSVRNRCRQLYHGHSQCALHGYPCHATRVGSCSPENIGWTVTPP